MVLLLKLAYLECRNSGRQCVNQLDITRAYRAAAYTASAGEVEELMLLALSSLKKHKLKDLHCPFDLSAAMKTNVVNFTRADRQEPLLRSFTRKRPANTQ